jgi:hypothetical protein
MAQSHIEVRLVNANVGTPHCDYFFNDWLCNTTNDTGLNTILSNHGSPYFRVVEGHPYQPYQGRIFNISNSTNDAQLAADLSAYSSVIDHAVVTTSTGFSDALEVTLNDINVGIPTGMSGNVVVTNDSGLNTLFQSYNVFHYQLAYPSYPQFQMYYSLVCDCDVTALKAAIDSYTAVILDSYYISGAMLGNNQLEKPKAIISPNPFSDSFYIETEQTISSYSVIDITGKTIVSTSSKSDLDNQSSQLSAGIYILNLSLDNGQQANYKLVKK